MRAMFSSLPGARVSAIPFTTLADVALGPHRTSVTAALADLWARAWTLCLGAVAPARTGTEMDPGAQIRALRAAFRRQTAAFKRGKTCVQLRGGRDSVTDIAFALGFSSSQYFATVFRRFMGCTPVSQWFHPRPFPPPSLHP
jgi:Bacterial regulatory helix-turn-helix proteins, AraC family